MRIDYTSPMAVLVAVCVLMGAFAAGVWAQRDRIVGHGPVVSQGCSSTSSGERAWHRCSLASRRCSGSSDRRWIDLVVPSCAIGTGPTADVSGPEGLGCCTRLVDASLA